MEDIDLKTMKMISGVSRNELSISTTIENKTFMHPTFEFWMKV